MSLDSLPQVEMSIKTNGQQYWLLNRFYYQDSQISSPSPARSLFHAVCLYVWQRWDQPCAQQVRPSWLLRVYQCADGYHHRRDARRAVERREGEETWRISSILILKDKSKMLLWAKTLPVSNLAQSIFFLNVNSSAGLNKRKNNHTDQQWWPQVQQRKADM